MPAIALGKACGLSTVVQLSAYRPDPPSEVRGPDELDEPLLAEDLLAIGRLLQTFMQEVAASNLGPRSKAQVLDQSRSASALLLEAAHILRGSLTARLEASGKAGDLVALSVPLRTASESPEGSGSRSAMGDEEPRCRTRAVARSQGQGTSGHESLRPSACDR